MIRCTRLALLGLVAFGACSAEAQACSVCFGGADGLVSHSLNAGVLALVASVVVVLSSIAYTAWVWARRAKQLRTSRTTM